ncbi:MAG: class I SAM-dependent methyltransferase, partial [Acidobacteria bacterium]
RGSEEEVRRRQAAYVEHFVGRQPVIDIGCGRGEFLGLLRDAGIQAVGVDSSSAMVRHCLEKGVVACHSDGVTYLSRAADQSIGSVFCSHVLEHMRPDAMSALLRLCHDKLVPGGVLVVETVNPCCLSTHASFAADPAHERPLHPDWLAFLLEISGLEPIARIGLSPHAEEARLAAVPEAGRRNGDPLIRIFNENVEKLNQLLFGCSDYAVIARVVGGSPACATTGCPACIAAGSTCP